MHQLVVWTALAAEGLGASLQHYNPLIDGDIQAEWGVPASWKLVAQIPFGKGLAEPAEKQIADIDARLKVFR
jgi:predicted oxidoreductase (fatty acid repression mutant protein)